MRVLSKIVAGVLLLAGTAAAQPAAREPRELYNALNALRVDAARTYSVRELDVRREAVRLSFSEGKLAFLTALDGRVTGAVFSGRGRVLVMPRDPVEKRSLARFLDAPLLDQPFSRAYLRFTDNTAEELLLQLEQEKVQPGSEPSFGDDWNPTVGTLNPWHSLRVMADWLAGEPQPYFYAGLISEDRGPFDILVDYRQPESVVAGQTRWVKGARFYDVWTSFAPPGTEPPGEVLEPVSYKIETTIQPDRVLKGVTLAELKVLRGGERMITLELSRFLKAESATDATGRPLPFFQNEEINQREIAERGNDSLHIVFPEAPRAGQTITLRIAYAGTVISDAGNGVYFVGEHGSWYPHIAGTDHFAAFELGFRWPRRLQLVANGKKIEEREEGDWRIGRWKSESPVPVAGFHLGDYETASVQVGAVTVEVYANRQLDWASLWRLAHRPASSPVPARIPGMPGGTGMQRLSVPDAPPPSPAALLSELGTDVADAIRFNEKLSGPFPFERLAVAQIPGSFGQGWPGLLYLSTLSFLSPSAQSRIGVSGRTQEQFTDIVPSHEVAHQWWGSVVGWASYRDQWISEGLSNYLALLYVENKRPNEHPLNDWLQIYRRDLTAKEPDGDSSVEEAGPLMLGNRLRSSKAPGAYNQIVYGKGTWVMHMLRMMLRDPAAKNPDARFAQLLTSLIQAHRQHAMTTEDLQHAVEKVMTPAMDLEGGRSMEWFFDQWVRGTGIPRYAVDFSAKAQPNGTFVVRGTLTQSNVPEGFLASVPIYATRAAGKPVLLGTVVTNGQETPFKFTARVQPRKLLIDPNLTLLATTE